VQVIIILKDYVLKALVIALTLIITITKALALTIITKTLTTKTIKNNKNVSNNI
jgi:hypothetical protein